MLAMAEDQYRARATELLAQSKLEQDPEVAAMLEAVGVCFQQLADTPTLSIDFELPRKGMFFRDRY
jgi:hypothetical protein